MTQEYSFNQPEASLSPDDPKVPEHEPALREGGVALEATVEPASGSFGGGWTVRLPVRAEQVTVSKETVVVERVVVRRQQRADTLEVDELTRSERLRLELDDGFEVRGGRTERVQPGDPGPAPASWPSEHPGGHS